MKKNIVPFKELEKNAEILKALAHPVRLCIVIGLLKNGSCNVSDMHLCLEMPQSTISQHLAKLKSVGIIKGERRGVEIMYSVQDDFSKELASIIIKNKNK